MAIVQMEPTKKKNHRCLFTQIHKMLDVSTKDYFYAGLASKIFTLTIKDWCKLKAVLNASFQSLCSEILKSLKSV